MKKIVNNSKKKKISIRCKMVSALGIWDWGLGIVDWAQSPIPNPQSPIPNPQSPKRKKKLNPLNI